MHIGLIVIAGLGFMADALEISIMSFLGTSLEAQWGISKATASHLGEAVFAGEIVGCFFWGPLSDFWGR